MEHPPLATFRFVVEFVHDDGGTTSIRPSCIGWIVMEESVKLCVDRVSLPLRESVVRHRLKNNERRHSKNERQRQQGAQFHLYFAKAFIASVSPCTVVGYMRSFMIFLMMSVEYVYSHERGGMGLSHATRLK